MSLSRRVGLALAGACVLAGAGVVVGGCAVKVYSPPSGPSQPMDDAAQVWNAVTQRCRTTSPYAAEIRVSGWVGSPRQRIAPTIHGAVTRDNGIYLEIPAPGGPVVQMAGRDGTATFVLPRDKRVLTAPTRDIIEALTGLHWDAVDLLNVLTGCVQDPVAPVTGVTFGAAQSDGQVTIPTDSGEARAWLRRRQNTWVLQAGARDGLMIEYRQFYGAFPSEVRITATVSTVTAVDLVFLLGQINTNTPLPDSALTLAVPSTYVPMTLADLRSLRPIDEGKSPD